jgi:hypothetical protein
MDVVNGGYLLGHEHSLYIFDLVLMLGVMTVFNLVHPSEIKALLHGGRVLKNDFQCKFRTVTPPER